MSSNTEWGIEDATQVKKLTFIVTARVFLVVVLLSAIAVGMVYLKGNVNFLYYFTLYALLYIVAGLTYKALKERRAAKQFAEFYKNFPTLEVK